MTEAPRINAVEVALKYAKDVIAGRIITGKLNKLAAKRFLRDLLHCKDRGFEMRPDYAQRVVDFFGRLHHSKGEWGKKPFILSPWETFILTNLFGWIKTDGTRRFREAYIEIARKNGKSTFVAGIGLYMLTYDGEEGAEVYCAATKKEQAKIIFDEACRMRQASPYLAKTTEVSGKAPRWHGIYQLDTSSKFEPQTAEGKTLDGLNAHCIILDEVHEHPTRELYDKLAKSTGARRQPLTISITTAGYDRQGICFKLRSHGEKILVGAVEPSKGDSFFCFIACIDTEDENLWQDEKVWAKANPNLGVCVKLSMLHDEAAKSENDNSALTSFFRYNLNLWTSADVRWMSPTKWAACNSAPLADPKELRLVALEKLKGRVCYGGLDLSSNIDLTAFVLIFPPLVERVDINDKVIQEADPNWYVLPWFFVPANNIEERCKKDGVEYDAWQRQGFISTTPGNSIDQRFIRATINTLRGIYKIAEIGFDKWNADETALELEKSGHKVVEVRQGHMSLSEPMKKIMALVLDKQLEHFGNPVLTWCALNVQARLDPNGNVAPDKQHSTEKIDGIVAMIMAMRQAIAHPDTPSIYAKRGVIFL